jgi:hypothetical protein
LDLLGAASGSGSYWASTRQGEVASMTTRSSIKLCATGLAALLGSAAASGARADLFTFNGTLANEVAGGTSVSGQFDFNFTTDAATSYKFTVPGDSLDSSVFNNALVASFTSSGTPYLSIDFQSSASDLILVFNPTITQFFTQSLPVDGIPSFHQSIWVCNTASCNAGLFDSTFASGTVTPSIPEPSTWAMMLLGFAGLGYAGYRASRTSAKIAA